MASFGDSAVQLGCAASTVLGWRPDEFWNATPAELALALQFPTGVAEPPDPATIEELRRRYPDK